MQCVRTPNRLQNVITTITISILETLCCIHEYNMYISIHNQSHAHIFDERTTNIRFRRTTRTLITNVEFTNEPKQQQRQRGDGKATNHSQSNTASQPALASWHWWYRHVYYTQAPLRSRHWRRRSPPLPFDPPPQLLRLPVPPSPHFHTHPHGPHQHHESTASLLLSVVCRFDGGVFDVVVVRLLWACLLFVSECVYMYTFVAYALCVQYISVCMCIYVWCVGLYIKLSTAVYSRNDSSNMSSCFAHRSSGDQTRLWERASNAMACDSTCM